MFFVITEPDLTNLFPELKICSEELIMSGIDNTVVCELVNTVLQCYAYVSDEVQACNQFIIFGSYNFI